MTDLLSVEEARARILTAILGPTRGETVSVAEALGRTLAAPVVAHLDLPPWDNSAMDGYAVRSADTAAASDAAPVRLIVVGDVAAGVRPGRAVERGEAVRIATGAPMPRGADAVVPVEATTPADAEGRPIGPRGRAFGLEVAPACLVHEGVAAGASVRRRAEDTHAGDVVAEAGRLVTPAVVAVAAGVGLAMLEVRTRPVVGVLATGDELRPAGAAGGGATIPDSNGPALRALVDAAGGDGLRLGIGADTLQDVRARLCAGLTEGAHVIVVSGGVSMGPYDHVRTAFGEVGSVDLWRVAVQPGKPFAFGTAPRPGGGPPVLLFGLPGNPVSTFVTFELFVRPAIRRLLGRARLLRPTDRGILAEPVATSPGRRAYLRVTAQRDATGDPVRDTHGRVVVRPAGGQRGQGSHVLSGLAAAEALAVVPEEVAVAPAGLPVEIWWMDGE